ncbi:hypothetical protein M1145_03080 [Patescibacteria group bacterium]|nr:hypothetical protein [Patescibacteria group bacterium]
MKTNFIWYSPDTNINAPDTIHQILMFGKLSDIAFLKKNLGKAKIKEQFLRYPKKIYTPAALNFIKNFILEIHTPIDEQQYLSHTSRSTR